MAVNPITSESLTLDFKSLMKVPVGDRVKAASATSLGQDLLNALTPIQLALAFPSYYRRALPDISNFIMANRYLDSGGRFNQTGGGAQGGAYPYYDGPDGVSPNARPAGSAPVTIDDMKERLLKKGINVDNVYSAVKGGAVLETDERLGFLKGSSNDELQKMGLERYQDENGKSLIRMLSVPAESMTIEEAERKLREESSLKAGLDSDTKLIEARTTKTSEALGIDQRQYNAFRQALADIESQGGEYGIVGGAGNHYSGAYQFGSAAMLDSAKALGMEVPSREEFLKNPELQEQFLDQYTALNHKTLMKVSPEYQNMTPEERLGVLGYAHNQGAGGAAQWLKTGTVGSDAFGTKGTKYVDAISSQLNETKDKVVSDPNKQYSEAEIKAYIDQLTEKQRKELIESGIRYQYNKPSMTSSDAIPDPEGRTVVENQGEVAAVRKQPITPELKEVLQYAGEESGVIVEVFSGGQNDITEGGPRTGSERHDLGHAADVKLQVMGADGKLRYLDARNPDDQAMMSKFVETARMMGAKGIGSGLGYMGESAIHVGTVMRSDLDYSNKEYGAPAGKEAVWESDKWAQDAFARGQQAAVEFEKAGGMAEFRKRREERIAAQQKEQSDKTAAKQETVMVQSDTPVPQMALGGNMYGLNEDMTIVDTATGNPIAQVNSGENLIKQGNSLEVTPETKVIAEQLSDNTSADTTGIEEPDTQPTEAAINKPAVMPKTEINPEPMWRESLAATAYGPSPSYQRAINKAKYQNTEREKQSWSRAKIS